MCVCVCVCVYVCVCACTRTRTNVYTCACTRVFYRRVYTYDRMCLFFFFFHSFFPLIIKAYFMLQSVECAGNRQSVFFFPSSFSLFPFIPSLFLPLVTLRRVRRLIESEKSEKRKASEFPGVPKRSTNNCAFRGRARENHSSRAFLFFQRIVAFRNGAVIFRFDIRWSSEKQKLVVEIFSHDIVDMELLKLYSLIAFSKIDFSERSIINK